MNYLEIKTFEAADDLRCRLHRLTVESLCPANSSAIILPQPSIIHGLLTQYEDPFILTANVTGLNEEWYRRGIITGIKLKSDTDFIKLFENRNQHLLESFKQWLVEEMDRLMI